MMSLTKIHPPEPKNFFRVQTRRLADLFEPLNSSLVQQRRSYGVVKATKNCCFLGRNLSTNISYAGSQSVLVFSFSIGKVWKMFFENV